MHDLGFLKDLIVIFGSAVLVVGLLRRIGVPTIAGFILTGVAVGPSALGLVPDPGEVEVLAEIGVVLLLFGIGLELSLDRLRRFWKAVVLGGGFQVVATIALTAVIATWRGLAVGSSIFLGCVVAVSSTAVVLRGLSGRSELNAPHGRLAVGILVFQDLCVVPMILALPLLAGDGGSTRDVLRTGTTAVLIIAGVLLAARVVVPRLLAFVASTRQRELFVLSVFLVCIGTAWAVSLAGVSLALGAFLAGLVVAGSEFRHQALSDLIPARELFASLFFVSVGMLLDVPAVVADWVPTLGLLLGVLLGKFVIVYATARMLRFPMRLAILSAATLCQIGEFSFVLLDAAEGTQLLEPRLAQNLLGAIILSMLLTPLAIAFAPHLASTAARIPWLNRVLGADPPGFEENEPHRDHVIVAGYGYAGRCVCRALREREIPYVAVDVNPDNVRAAKAAGDRAVLGDITQREVLKELGCAQAVLVVLSINDSRGSVLAIRTIADAAPGVRVVARTQYETDRDTLLAAGANRIVTEERTAGEALASVSLAILADGP